MCKIGNSTRKFMEMEKKLRILFITTIVVISNLNLKCQDIEEKIDASKLEWLVYPISTQNRPHEWACEPSIATNPLGDQIIAGSVLDQVHRVKASNNFKSNNWIHQTLESPFGVWGDPIIQYDYRGRAYFLHLATPNGKKDEDYLDRIVLQYSDDHGASWSTGSSIGYNPPKDQDKEGIAIDKSNTLHVSWTEFDKYGESDKTKYRSRIRYSQSTDQGETWSPAITISSNEGDCIDDDNTTEGAIPAVDPSMGVVVIWSFQDTIWLNRSDDDGAITWLSQERPIATHVGGWAQEIPGFGRANGMPISQFELDGDFHLVFGEQESGEKSWLVHMVSKDGGVKWSNKQKIPVPDGVIHHFMPWFTIDSTNNSLHIIAYGQKDSTTWETQAYHTYSNDGGQSWHHHALAESFSPTPNHFFGDYNGIVAHPKSGIHMVWTQQNDGVNSIYYCNMKSFRELNSKNKPKRKKRD